MRLIELFKPSIAGLASRRMYAAISHEATHGQGIVVTIAEVEGSCGGIFVVILKWPQFWRGFLWRHPLLGLQILAVRLFGRLRRLLAVKRGSEKRMPDAVAAALAREPSGRSWSDYSPTIGKALYSATDPKHRGAGVGVCLYHHMFEVLSSRGITRVDGLIAIDNIANVRLCQKTGWRTEHAGESLFTTVDLPGEIQKT